jgi:hypothetical protein
MKAVLGVATLFLAVQASLLASNITQWNFNSTPPDADTTTGSLNPSLGAGTATNINLVSSAFAGGGAADPAASSDDSAWKTGNYPAQGFGNKTGGVQFNVSTAGYSNIVVRWDQMISSTASKYYRFQYATNGVSFYDYPTPIIMSNFSVWQPQTNSLAAVPNANNNPNFAFRIVSEWESSAIGTTFTGYAPPFLTNHYDQSFGAVRYEYVTVSGTAIPDGNTAPFISGQDDQTIRVEQSTGPLAVTVVDAEDPATSLTMNGVSSNPSIIPSGSISFGGSGSARTVNVTAGVQTGAVTVAVWVIDTGGKSNSATFNVTVLAANTAPIISPLPRTNTLVNGTVGPIPFIIGDAETSAGSLGVSANCANPGLVDNSSIHLGGTDSNRTVTITPAASRVGIAPITVTVSDGTNSASSLFAVLIRASSAILFADSFDYPNGSLMTNSGFLWDSRSGTFGQCQVTNNQLLVAGAQGEDVDAPLIGAPFAVGSNATLYAAFRTKFLTLPKEKADYFAHFNAGSTFRGRVFAAAPTNLPAGFFRLQLANNTNTTELPTDLTTNISYLLVFRYSVDTATTTMWVDPAAENSPGVTALDAASALAITTYGFRQDAGVGADILVDDFKVGLSFLTVTETNTIPVNAISLQYQRVGRNLILTWSNPAFTLQSAPAATGSFTNIPSAASPYTNSLSGTARFFRLKGD